MTSLLQAISTRGEQIEYLLSDALPRRPPKDVVLFAKVLIETKQGHHMEKIGVSTHDMEFIRGFNVDQTSHDVPGKEISSGVHKYRLAYLMLNIQCSSRGNLLHSFRHRALGG